MGAFVDCAAGDAVRGWFRRRRAQAAGYAVGFAGRSHEEMPRFETLDEPVAWVVGWQYGHARWMFASLRR
jgi:ribosome modulation factor